MIPYIIPHRDWCGMKHCRHQASMSPGWNTPLTIAAAQPEDAAPTPVQAINHYADFDTRRRHANHRS
jgi:hypothetical protein